VTDEYSPSNRIMVSDRVGQMGHGTKGVGASWLTMMTTNDSYKMHNLGLAKSYPSVLRSNRILICVNGGGIVSKFEGIVYCACHEYVVTILSKMFRHAHVNGLLVDVRFTFSQRLCAQDTRPWQFSRIVNPIS
jgi:hypothetical protein